MSCKNSNRELCIWSFKQLKPNMLRWSRFATGYLLSRHLPVDGHGYLHTVRATVGANTISCILYVIVIVSPGLHTVAKILGKT